MIDSLKHVTENREVFLSQGVSQASRWLSAIQFDVDLLPRGHAGVKGKEGAGELEGRASIQGALRTGKEKTALG